MGLKSKNISDYFSANLSDLIADRTLPFEIHLYFPQNQHILIWLRTGDTPTADFLEKYASRGLNKIWIHFTEKEAFALYLRGEQEAAPAPKKEPKKEKPKELKEKVQTEEGAVLATTMNSEDIPEEHKEAIVAEAAQDIIAEVAQAETLEDQEKAQEKARQIIEDVLNNTTELASSAVAEIWKMANVDPDLEHGVNVATYATIFSMAFGRIDKKLIADIAMSGLLHDIGLSMMSSATASQAFSKLTDQQRPVYEGHVNYSVELLKLESNIPDRVGSIIEQHHEKFDGTGYPKKLKGFSFNDISQLVAIAELMISIQSGHYNGDRHTAAETFDLIDELESAKNFPQYFDPEVFNVVRRWARKKQDKETLASAADMVSTQATQIVQQGKKEAS